ncbi:hypothetical protein ACFTZF_47120 [Streptomyces mirabilis]|uniref:hypothetical protein n=1 Tax=Streptomyces mirabilis TaxID=68239 RepID=UPI003642D437
MNNPMVDYRTFIRLDSAELSQKIRRNAPPKAPGQWIFALLDIACTDYYSVNQEPGINLAVRLLFASRLLDFVDQELGVHNPFFVTRAYMKVARKAIEGGAHEVPHSLTADAVTARTLRCFRLTRAQALEVAGARRDRYLDALTAGLEGEEFRRTVRVDGDTELNTVTVLLPKARWFQGKITGRDIAGELNAWLDIYSDLELGDTVAELLNRRQRRSQEGT